MEPTALLAHARGLEARWNQAQIQCRQRQRLRSSELQRASHFKTLEEVETALRTREQEEPRPLVTNLLAQVYPCLSAVDACLHLLLTASPPLNIEFGLFYGLLHVIITRQDAMGSFELFARLVEMLAKIRQELVYLHDCARDVMNSEEMQESIVESHIIWLDFLVEGQSAFRDSTKAHLTSAGLATLEKAFSVACGKHSSVVNNIARHSKLGVSRRSANNIANPSTISGVIEESGNIFPCSNLPAKPARFYGREHEYKLMDEYFDRRAADENRTFVLHGLGGTGKTSMALEYAYDRKKSYDVIFWFKSETAATIRASFVQIANLLGLAGEDLAKDSNSLSLRIRTWLQKTEKKWLLIYDNVEKPDVVEDNVPTGNGHVLMTTRFRWLAIRKGGRTHELNTLSPELGLEMFMGLCEMWDPKTDRESERSEIEMLLKELDGLPLAIEQIAAYVSYRRPPVVTFRKQYARSSRRIHAHSEASPSGKSLATLWDVQFTEIQDKPAGQVLGLLSLLSAETIPLSLFTLDEDDTDEIADIVGFPEDIIEDSLDHLMKVALIKLEGGSISVHRLVQVSFLGTSVGLSSSQLQPLFDKVCKALNHRFPKSDTEMSHFGRWEACAKYLPHVQAVANLYESRYQSAKSQMHMPGALVRLIRNCVWYQYESGDHADALALLEIGYHGCTDQTGLDYAYLCSHGACVLYERNDTSNGQKRINTALEIRTKLLDPLDGQLGNTLSNKALLEASECRYIEALSYFDQSLHIRKKLQNTYLAANHILKGMTLVLMRKFEEAKIDLDKGAALCREGGSKMDILNALQLFWSGNIALGGGDLLQARNIFRKALEIKIRKAQTHVTTSSYHYKVGLVEFNLGNIGAAIEKFDTAIEIAQLRHDEGEQARVLRMKAAALRQKVPTTSVDIETAQEIDGLRKRLIERALKDKDPKFRSLPEDEQYDLAVCAERR